jgi:hypothetical protein
LGRQPTLLLLFALLLRMKGRLLRFKLSHQGACTLNGLSVSEAGPDAFEALNPLI